MKVEQFCKLMELFGADMFTRIETLVKQNDWLPPKCILLAGTGESLYAMQIAQLWYRELLGKHGMQVELVPSHRLAERLKPEVLLIWAGDERFPQVTLGGSQVIAICQEGNRQVPQNVGCLTLTACAPGTALALAANHSRRLLTLLLLGACLAQQLGYAPAGQSVQLLQAAEALFAQLYADSEQVEQALRAAAYRWGGVDRVEIMGDGADLVSARFTASAMGKISGCLATVSDCENWCHVNFYGHPIKQIGTMFFVQKDANNLDIACKAAYVAQKLGRKLLVVADEQAQALESLPLCLMPSCICAGIPLASLVNHLAGILLATQLAAGGAQND